MINHCIDDDPSIRSVKVGRLDPRMSRIPIRPINPTGKENLNILT